MGFRARRRAPFELERDAEVICLATLESRTESTIELHVTDGIFGVRTGDTVTAQDPTQQRGCIRGQVARLADSVAASSQALFYLDSSARHRWPYGDRIVVHVCIAKGSRDRTADYRGVRSGTAEGARRYHDARRFTHEDEDSEALAALLRHELGLDEAVFFALRHHGVGSGEAVLLEWFHGHRAHGSDARAVGLLGVHRDDALLDAAVTLMGHDRVDESVYEGLIASAPLVSPEARARVRAALARHVGGSHWLAARAFAHYCADDEIDLVTTPAHMFGPAATLDPIVARAHTLEADTRARLQARLLELVRDAFRDDSSASATIVAVRSALALGAPREAVQTLHDEHPITSHREMIAVVLDD